MSQSKSLLAGIFLVGGLAGLVPLFLHDKNNVNITPPADIISNSVAEASAKPNTIGKYSGITLNATNLTSEERMKVYEAEQKVYEAYEDVLTQRYIADFFSKYQKEIGRAHV